MKTAKDAKPMRRVVQDAHNDEYLPCGERYSLHEVDETERDGPQRPLPQWAVAASPRTSLGHHLA